MSVAEVWVIAIDELTGSSTEYLDALSSDERAAFSRFRFDADRRAYLAAHGLARAALSSRAPGVEPAAWRFRTTPHGRPEIDQPTTHRTLRFNLSHTRRTVACVVTGGGDCGVDVEEVDRGTDVDLLARGVLTDAERAGLAPGDHTRFFRHWTLKEAYAKARGLGLALPLDAYGFALSDPPALLDPPDDDPAAWRFTQWQPGPTTVAAVAVRAGDTLARHDTPPATAP